MRVISGKARGRKLQAPMGVTTRPTPDRVKEALFSILQGRVTNARVLDLFAGSGALGLEALSRGAVHATFVEQDRAALAALAHNVQAAADGGPHSHHTLAMPVARALDALGRAPNQFDLIFLDPPYDLGLVPDTLQRIARHRLLAPEGCIVAEHSGQDPSPEAPEALQCKDHRRYGDVALSFYGRITETPSETSSVPVPLLHP